MKWLISALGIALVAGAVMAAATYLGLERKIESGQTFAVTLDRLYQDQKLAGVLKAIQEGDVDMAAQRLDIVLCDDILALNSQLMTADTRQQAYAHQMFVRIAHVRPGNSTIAAGGTRVLSDDQIEAEKILADACFAIAPLTENVAVLW